MKSKSVVLLISIGLIGCMSIIDMSNKPGLESSQIVAEKNDMVPKWFVDELNLHHDLKKQHGENSVVHEREHLPSIELMGNNEKYGTEKNIRNLANKNYWVTSYYRNKESKYYPSYRNDDLVKYYSKTDAPTWPWGLPRVCIAMSGGGVRSAAFNIGVLQALEERRFIDNTDVISASSGGAYALSWLYSHLTLDPKITPKMVLSDNAPSMKYLDMALPFIDFEQGVALSTVTTLFLPMTISLDKLGTGFGFYMGGSLNLAYVAKLELTFQANQSVTIGDIRNMVAGKVVPIPVINVTALRQSSECGNISQCENIKSTPLAELVFENTPFRRGNYALGFTDRYPHGPGDKNELLLSQLVAMSGAALDRPGALYYDLARILSLHTGAKEDFVSTPLLYNQPNEIISPQKSSDTILYNTSLYYTDAGYSDNLAAYSLVRRLCSNILIIDAEQDPSLRFEAYHNLKDRLRNEHNLILTVPDIDSYPEAAEHLCLGDHAWESKCFRGRNLKENGYYGSVSSIPYLDMGGSSKLSDGVRDLSISIRYLKLGINNNNMRQYSAAVRDYYDQCQITSQALCKFPHDPTTNQNLSKDAFHAYRALGYDLARIYILRQ